MGLPPRPKGRPLVRRAVVASMLVAAGCDQGVKRSTPPQVPDRHQVVAPQVAPPEPPHDNPDPVAIAPQVAYANGFALELVDVNGKPLVGVKAKVTINAGEAFEVTTSERGDAYVSTRIDGGQTATIEVEGYARVENATIEGDMSPSLRVVLKKKRR